MSFVTDWKFGTIAANDASVGTAKWVDPFKVLTNNPDENFGYDKASFFAYIDQFSQTNRAHNAKLLVGGAIVGTNQANDTSDYNYVTPTRVIGGTANTWGVPATSLNANAVRRDDFGVAVSMCIHASGGTLSTQSNYIVVSGFGFEIPLGATIVGVEVEVTMYRTYAGPGIDSASMSYLRARITYDYDFNMIGDGKSDGFIKINEAVEPQISQAKSYQYLAYENNVFRGQWLDVQSTPSLQINLNELPGELPVVLARNLDSKQIDYDDILLSGYGGTELLITTQNRETILVGEETSYGIGAGTDLEVDHTVKVKEYYGGYEALLTHSGEELLTSSLEPLVVPVGAPRGRMYYHGYVSDYGLIYDVDNKNTEVKLLHLSDEMNNEVYKTPDTLKTDTLAITPTGMSALGFGGFFKYAGDSERVGFSFTAASSYDLKRIVALISGWRDNIITATLRTGSTIGSGTVLGYGTANIDADGVLTKSFAFADAVPVVNATVYNVVFDSAFQKQTGSQSYPASIYFGQTYAGGASQYYADGAWINVTEDIGFQLWQNGGNTRVSELSIDPSQIMRKVLDYNKLQGGVISYDQNSIVTSFTTVSAPFNTNTIKDAADYILKLTPADWYYYIDPGQLLFNLKPRPVVPAHFFTLKKDIVTLKLHKNIEKIVNNTLFTGGGNPALYRELVDIASRAQWRKGLARLSDNRVTDNTTADLLAQAVIDQYSDPIWIGELVVLRSEHPNMVYPGELGAFRNFGNLIDTLKVQMMSVNVTPDTFVIQLGTLLPKTSQRIEDIKRNLNAIELENNPNAPA
jgi:mRNA-degrading endonuclease RelE of RelBE toxin-antitoxin system